MRMRLIVALILLLFSIAVTPRLIPTTAWFTSETESTPKTVNTGNLNVEMDIQEMPFPGVNEIPASDYRWIPGNYGKWLVTITNKGSLDARFRLGIQPKPTYGGNDLEQDLVVHLFRIEGRKKNGGWTYFSSKPLEDYLRKGTADRWVYSDQLDPDGWLTSGGNPFSEGILKAGDSCQLGIIIEFSRTATSRLRGQEFEGKFLLEAVQSNAQW